MLVQRLHSPLPLLVFRGPSGLASCDDIERQRLADDQAALDAYDVQIRSIDAIRDELDLRRKEARRFVRRREHYLSSFRKVPTEVWIEIFSLVCRKRSSNDDGVEEEKWWPSTIFPIEIGYNERLSPYTLSQVCHRWRDIAIHCEELWVNISIDVPFVTKDIGVHRHRPALDTFALALQRSGNRKITLRLESYPAEEDDFYHGIPSTTWTLFRKALSRTETLDIAADLLRHIDFGEGLSFPNLRHIYLDSRSPLLPLPGPYAREQLHALFAAPHLKSLDLQTMRWVVAITPFPFRGLTSFTCEDPVTMSDLGHLSQCCPRLVVLAVRISGSPDMGVESSILHFPVLETFVLYNGGWNAVFCLRRLRTPSLITLLYESTPCTCDMLECVLDFLIGSQCQLTAIGLKVDEECFIEEYSGIWTRLIEKLPFLHTLDVVVHVVSAETAREISCHVISVLCLGRMDARYGNVFVPELKDVSVTVEQRGFWCMNGTDVDALIRYFMDVMGSRRTCHNRSEARFTPLEKAFLSLQFHSWSDHGPHLAYYADLKERHGVDSDVLHRRIIDLASVGLDVAIKIGSYDIPAPQNNFTYM
ncbi:hypothetical protein AAF712_012841 [Marasmius tenuissimus]|uniref:F-box domain-containing protein n=1 Tax=Marasmius tenuissimus TaxID=585030 RepID=A0ABR2ZFG1_9AGAR